MTCGDSHSGVNAGMSNVLIAAAHWLVQFRAHRIDSEQYWGQVQLAAYYGM